MTSKIYKTAQGKTIDLGVIMLKNEHVRAVGNMNVNARGDKLDQNNQVIETKPRQIQRQNQKITNVTNADVDTSTTRARRNRKERQQEQPAQDIQLDMAPAPVEEPTPLAQPPVQNETVYSNKLSGGGLAAAIARTREVKQELEKTRRQQQQSQGLRKI